MDLDDFVEMTKKYAQGIVPSVPQDGSQVTVKTEIPKPHDSGRGREVKKKKKTAIIEIRTHNKHTDVILFFNKNSSN